MMTNRKRIRLIEQNIYLLIFYFSRHFSLSLAVYTLTHYPTGVDIERWLRMEIFCYITSISRLYQDLVGFSPNIRSSQFRHIIIHSTLFSYLWMDFKVHVNNICDTSRSPQLGHDTTARLDPRWWANIGYIEGRMSLFEANMNISWNYLCFYYICYSQ